MMVWMAFGAVANVLNILSFTWDGLSKGLIAVLIYGYSFLVYHSLRENFREDTAQGVSIQIKQTNAPPRYAESTASQNYNQQPNYAESYSKQAYNP